MTTKAYKRILLKLSGEALMGDSDYGIKPDVLARIAAELKELVDTGIELALVVGGGNIFRGISSSAQGMDRPTADYMGMLATVMNAMALADALKQLGVDTHVLSGLEIRSVVESYARERAIDLLKQKSVVIFGAGTGNPFFTTDTAASLRGLEIDAEVVFKATKVDGVFDRDPAKHADAKRFEELTYDEVLEKRLGVMDATAIALCRDNNMPLRVINLNKPGSLLRAARGEREGTLVKSGA
ncbi:MAG: UMP kinase [Gammaproteobacteria bacterium]|nr:UMP kinase [Gammaproteobacteria bacterium]